ncbi:hypothetical protein [Streptomyces parvulus]|uniref:hypothetical protein n=1 Tax=Streptomyces parvulus TaxID=146923 RepID=UPI0037956DCA
MEDETQHQPTNPLYAWHCNASNVKGLYNGTLHACKQDVHACNIAAQTGRRTEAVTRAVQLLAAIAGLLTALAPWIAQLL